MPLRLTQRWTPLEREQCRASLVILSQTLLYCNYSRVFIGKCILAYLWNSTKEHIHTGKQHTPCPSVSLKKLMIANSLNDQFCLPAIFQNKRGHTFLFTQEIIWSVRPELPQFEKYVLQSDPETVLTFCTKAPSWWINSFGSRRPI